MASSNRDGSPTLAEGLSKSLTGLLVGAAAATLDAGAAAGGLNEDYNNRQLHQSEAQLAERLAKISNGKFTERQIADAMRSSGNSQLNETVLTGRIVEGRTVEAANSGVYDKTAYFNPTRREDGSYVYAQVLPSVDPALAAYVVEHTGGSKSPYYDLQPKTVTSDKPATSGGLRYEMVSANGERFRLAVADCPPASCQTGDCGRSGQRWCDEHVRPVHRSRAGRDLAQVGKEAAIGGGSRRGRVLGRQGGLPRLADVGQCSE